MSKSKTPSDCGAVVVLLRGGRSFSGGKAAEVAGKVYRGLGRRFLLASDPQAEGPVVPSSVR